VDSEESQIVGAKMRGSIQVFPALLFCMVHFKMRAKVCSLKMQAERISKSVHFKGAPFFFI
jgi:hypothetical protein